MNNFSNRRDREEMQELLKLYYGLKAGRPASFMEEDELERVVEYFDEKGDLPSAQEAADIGLQMFPASAILMVKKADLLIAARHFQEAMHLLEQAEILDAANIDIYILKIDALYSLNLPNRANQVWEAALQLFDGDDRFNLLFELADVYDDHEEFEKVFDCLYLILKDDPNNEEALLKICFWADFTGNCERSIKLHTWIIDEYPFNELAWFNLATAFQGIKLYEKAIDAYQYALAIDDTMDIAYRNMGDAYIRLRKYKDAIESLQRVIDLGHPEDVVYEAIGHCQQRLQNMPEARDNYRKAAQINPSDSRIYYKMASTYVAEQNWEPAVKQLEAALRIQPNQSEFNLMMGECKLAQGKLKDAIQFLSVAVRARPKSVAPREALIRCLLKGGFELEAAEQCVHASQATNGNPLFEYYAAAALFLMGKNKEGLLHLENGLRANPRLFKKILDLAPGFLQKQGVVDVANKYLKRKMGRKK